jgi:predicted nucleic acid-binding Zn ribbon protein
MQKMSDPAPSVCPVCNKPTIRKQLSAAGFQLKGTGWYATDFKGTPKPKSDVKTGGETKTGGENKTSPEAKTSSSKAGADSSTNTGGSTTVKQTTSN